MPLLVSDEIRIGLKAAEFGEITQNNVYYAVQDHSRYLFLYQSKARIQLPIVNNTSLHHLHSTVLRYRGLWAWAIFAIVRGRESRGLFSLHSFWVNPRINIAKFSLTN